MSIRDIRRRARRDLHRGLSERALHVRVTGKDESGALTYTARFVSVRLHLSFPEAGPRDNDYAHVLDTTPRMIFMRDEVSLKERDIIVTEDRGAYSVGTVRPPEDITVAAEVAPLTDSQVASYGWERDAPFMGLGEA